MNNDNFHYLPAAAKINYNNENFSETTKIAKMIEVLPITLNNVEKGLLNTGKFNHY